MARDTDEVDFIAACVFLRGCAGSWTSFRVGKLPNLLDVHKAVLQDWRYNSNISVRQLVLSFPFIVAFANDQNLAIGRESRDKAMSSQ